jgi:hypothetical protein
MFDGTFEQAMILSHAPDGLARVIVRSSWDEREPILVEPTRPSCSRFGEGRSFTGRRSDNCLCREASRAW